MTKSLLLTLALAAAFALHAAPPVQPTVYVVGLAKVDITPTFPIRLSGYYVRTNECTNAAQRLYAKALAIGSDKAGPVVLLTVDNCGVPASVRDAVAQRLEGELVRNERLAVCSTHSHTTPILVGVLPNLFGKDIPDDQWRRIERYTGELTDKLVEAARLALKNRRPATLSWAVGKATFGQNRRAKGGPCDNDVPTLVIKDKKEVIQGILLSYACHCTTLGGDVNEFSPDWAGAAQAFLETAHPGAIVLTAIGCGADQNPFPRPGMEHVHKHGRELEAAVGSLLSGPLQPVAGRIDCQLRRIQLPFEPLPTREQWLERATNKLDYIAYHANKNLARLDRGEKLPTELPYIVQTWAFGEGLEMVFLAGEVVVDYALRLRRELDARRLWVNAYANDVPCYIPSKRILKEGGYEAEGSMVFYDRPARLSESIEDQIITTVHELSPATFKAK